MKLCLGSGCGDMGLKRMLFVASDRGEIWMCMGWLVYWFNFWSLWCWWKNISRGWLSLSCYILYEIGDGSRLKFWRDWWYRETPFAVSYPELFRNFQDKEASVAELMRFNNGVLHWDVSFFRIVHDWELEALLSFMDTIYGSSVRGM